MKTTIKKLEKSEVEIVGVLEVAEFEKYEDKALGIIGDRLELPGFRKGKAPATVVREHASEMMILEEMAEQALHDAYPKIIEEHKLDAIGRPQIAITKIAKGSDLEFKIITAVLPEMKLPDYKKLAKEAVKKNPVKVGEIPEAEVEKAILELRKMRAHQAMPKHEHEDGAEHPELSEEELPAFDDAFVKTFGEFASTDAFKDKIRGNLKMEKEVIEKDKLRLAIVEELLKETSGDIPEILIQSETDKILYKLEADITNMGFKFDDYLVQIKKTEEELRKEWRTDAEKRAKLQLTIHNISNKENLKPTGEEIEKEVTNIVTMYKDADPVRARAYVENMMENEKVFQFLESQ
jgi:FKBP-type peptidyl-prolyl cis-trans isomerase (trigger factor)